MSERPCKVLILDHDPEVLTRLQQVLEDAGVDTTITWDDREARELLQSTAFDVVLVGNHSPEVAAKTISLALPPVPQACMLLGASESKSEPLRRLGFAGVVPKREPERVLQAVQEHLHRKRLIPDRRPHLATGRLHQAL